MIDLKEISAIVAPVKVKRGNLELDLTCYSERISAENEEYGALLDEARKIDIEIQNAESALDLLCLKEYAEIQLRRPVMLDEAGNVVKPASEQEPEQQQTFELRDPTPDEIRARELDLQKRIEECGAAAKAALKRRYENKARRIVYLTETWSITDGDKQAEIKPEIITKYFTPSTIDLTLETIESQVFGPLVPLPGSGDS